MQYLSIPFFLALLASVNAKCHTTGVSADGQNVQSFLNPICAGLMGYYLKNEKRHQCVTDLANQQWDFTLEVKLCLPSFCSALQRLTQE